MVLADTCVWIDFLKGKEPVFSHMVSLLENGEVLGCELVFAELLQGAKTKRERADLLEYQINLPGNSIDGAMMEAGLESGKNKWKDRGVGIIDAAIYLYAKKNKALIWTIDKKLISLLPKHMIY